MTQVPVYIHDANGKPGLFVGFTHGRATPAEVAGRVFSQRRKNGFWATAVRWGEGWLVSAFKPADEQVTEWESRVRLKTDKLVQQNIAH